MLDPLTSIKQRVRELKPYSLGTERGKIKLNQNENPWDAPARLKEVTFDALKVRAWSRYPDFIPTSLNKELARFNNWMPEGIVSGNGSNELIQALLMVTIGEGRKVLICEPTFALYRQITTILSGDLLSVPLKDDLTFDSEAILQEVEVHQPAITIICSPNNPTGCVIEDDDLIAILKASNGIVALDEAYFEFSGHTAAPLCREFPNLAVFRTFSKAMAMAALRVGYLIAAPELACEVSKAVLPYNLNAVSQTAAEIAVGLYDEELRPTVEAMIAERERVFVALAAIDGLCPVRSRANFMIVKSSIEPRTIFRQLLDRGILIRDVSGYPMLKDYFRASIGTPDENDALLMALQDLFANGA